MATQPKPAPKPPSPKPDDDDAPKRSPPEAGMEAPAEAAAPQQTYAGEPCRTIADEQRERSDEIARQGVEAWKAERDERDPEDKPKQVPGVSPRVNDPGAPPQAEGGSWEGSTRSTPEARRAQHRSAP